LLHIWRGTPEWKTRLAEGKRLQETGAVASASSQPAAASGAHQLRLPLPRRFPTSSLGNLQSCVLVVKDSFLYFHMV